MTPLLVPLLLSVAGADVGRLGDDGFRVGRFIDDAVLSPDGRTFAVTAGAGVFLLDATTGHVAAHWEEAAPPNRVAFDHAGRVLVFDGTRVRRTDPRTGRVLREWAVGPPFVREGAFHGGGRFFTAMHVFAGGRSLLADTTHLIDLETGGPATWAARLWTDQRWALSADGRRFAVTATARPLGVTPEPIPEREALLRVIDPTTGRSIYTDPVPTDAAEILTFAPEGRSLVVGRGTQFAVIDVETGSKRQLKLEVEADQPGVCGQVVVSPGAKRLACVGSDYPGVLREWDMASGKLRVRQVGTGPGPFRAGYTPAGRLLVWNLRGCRLDVIAPNDGPLLPRTGHAYPLHSVEFSPDGRQVVSTDVEGDVCRWEAPDERVEALASPSPAGECGQDYAPADPQLPVPTYNRPGNPFAFREVALPAPDDLWPGSRRAFTPLSYSAESRLVAALLTAPGSKVADQGRFAIGIYPLRDDHRPSLLELPARPDAGVGAFSSDRRSFFVGLGGRVASYDVATGRVRRVVEPGAKRVEPLVLSPDGRLLLAWAWSGAGDEPDELRLIELATGSTRRAWPWPRCPRPEARPCFSPDGRTIALPLADATIRLLPTESAAPPPKEADLWDALASPDAAVAGAAVRALADRSDADEWVRDRLVEAPDRPVADWLADLDHDDFDRREAARVALARRPDLARRIAAAATSPSLHLRQLLSDLAEERLDPPTADELRRDRIREAMDRLANRPARRPPP